MKTGRMLCLALAATALLTPISCFGWGDGGHEMVALIAYKRLKPTAKSEVDRLLAIAITPADRPHATTAKGRFMHAAHWPDDVRGIMPATGDEHYADFPFSPDNTPLPHLPKPVNVIEAIKAKVKILKQSTNDVEKAKALRFLIHYVGDIHQPLHCSTRVTAALPNGDQGGNDFFVKATDDTGHFKTVKLHSHWDGGLGTFPKTGAGFTPPPDNEIQPAATIALVGNSASNPQIGIGGAFNVDLWAKESEGLARSTAYANLVNHGPDSATYRHNGIVAARQRIAWAGYRLANLLNAIYP